MTMTRPSSLVSWLYHAALLATAFLAIEGSAAGQTIATPSDTDTSVFDAVDECDLLAAHPDDRQRMAEGVPDGSIIPRLATRACTVAAQRHPGDMRFVYQLGRALAAAGRNADAAKQFERAAQGEYAAALAAQADLRLDIFAAEQRTERSPAEAWQQAQRTLGEAIALHERAYKGGFLPSSPRIWALTFDPSTFMDPIIGRIFYGQIDDAKALAITPTTKAYFYALVVNIINQCGPVLSIVSIRGLTDYRFIKNPMNEETESKPDVAMQPLIGEIDAQRFVKRHGCEGIVSDMFFEKSLPAFLALM